jgi:hypothetical protein
MLLLTIPDTLEVGSAETYPLAIDMSALLAGGENADSPVCTLIDLVDDTTYAAGIPVPPAATGTKLVTVVLTALVAGHRYRLITTCQPNAVTKTVETATTIVCPF